MGTVSNGDIKPVIFPVSDKINPGGSSPSPLAIKYFKVCPAAVSLSTALISKSTKLESKIKYASLDPIGSNPDSVTNAGSSAPSTVSFKVLSDI